MILKEKKIKKFITLFLEKLKLKKKDAKIISEYLVNSDMAGHFSHGINRMFQYETSIEKKIISMNNKIKFYKKNNFLQVDGKFNFGQLVMCQVCNYLKRNKSINFVSIINAAHIGRLSDYVEEMAKSGFTSLFFVSGGGPNVSPFSTQNRMVGTNPFAFATPLKNKNIFVTDFSSSALAEGKINIAMKEKKILSEKVIIDAFGRETNKPKELYKGGAIKPFGGHKGSAFSIVIEILSGLLFSQNVSFKKSYHDGNNCFLILFKNKKFFQKNKTQEQINTFFKKIKSGRKVKGYNKKIYLPGEIEKENYKRSKKKGIKYNRKMIRELLKLAHKKYNLDYRF